MGVLTKILSRGKRDSQLEKLPSGTFTLDEKGRIIATTLPGNFSESQMREIGQRVLAFFVGAQSAQISVKELNIHYATLKVTARSLRGGAIIFLSPQNFSRT
jgi:hypothetical protein